MSMSTLWNPARVRTLKLGDASAASPPLASVAYWMSRDQRAHDNWALLHAQQLACDAGVPLHVVFCLLPSFRGAPVRHVGFMLRGLAELQPELARHAIKFHLLHGTPTESLPSFAAEHGVRSLVCDFSPLREARQYATDVAAALPAGTSLLEVDAHNVVPCWLASTKLEVGARTLRPKIEGLLPTFLTEFPALRVHPHPPPATPVSPGAAPVDCAALLLALAPDLSVAEVAEGFPPGEKAAHAALGRFVTERLRLFGAKRNDPTVEATSGLSGYFHFGKLAPQRAALAVRGARAHLDSTKAFVEEAVVRRELSDNFCLHNPRYDQLAGAAGWARESLLLHAADPREWSYSQAQLERAQTHDDLWNAAQTQLVVSGKMHGFLRMYWAKKVLEWTDSPEEALRIALHLNDRYALDGSDPNGYTGVGWSIMGVHDMGWAERAVFGKIRYMNYAGCKRKFDVAAFVRKWPPAAGAGPGAGAAQGAAVKREGAAKTGAVLLKRSAAAASAGAGEAGAASGKRKKAAEGDITAYLSGKPAAPK